MHTPKKKQISHTLLKHGTSPFIVEEEHTFLSIAVETCNENAYGIRKAGSITVPQVCRVEKFSSDFGNFLEGLPMVGLACTDHVIPETCLTQL